MAIRLPKSSSLEGGVSTHDNDEMENDFDAAVGLRIRFRRRELKMTKKRLGEIVGVSGMQIGFHESGARRLGAARLYDISLALDVPITYFFLDFEQATVGDDTQRGPVEVSPEKPRDTFEVLSAAAELLRTSNDEKVHAVVRAVLRGIIRPKD